MALPRIIVTGASGFIGRHLLDSLKEEYEVYAIARRSQLRCGAPVHPNIRWLQVDIGERDHLASLFNRIRLEGAISQCIHLAAHYDFTGDRDPEYYRSNVDGLRNVLDLCKGIGLRRFLFSSSVAACAFPAPGQALNEDSEPDGDHIYAETKRIGEKMLAEYSNEFPSTIVRFAALFSDWCEYPPLFMFLQTWLSRAWNRRVLGGNGLSAIPYLHIRDGVSLLRRAMDRGGSLDPGEVVIASPDGAVSHLQLFESALENYRGQIARPMFMPKALCLPGIHARVLLGRLTGEMPFERPWMAKYIDLALTIDASRTRARLGWQPRERLLILRRFPFLLDNLRMDPLEWNRKNRAAMRQVRIRPNLKIHWLLEKHEQEISESFTQVLTGPGGARHFPSYQRVSPQAHEWNHRVTLRQLMNAIRTRDRAVFHSYCRDLAAERYRQGFSCEEVCGALEELNEICIRTLMSDPESMDVRDYLHDYFTLTIQFGCDQIQETFEIAAEREGLPYPENCPDARR